jgi:integrase
MMLREQGCSASTRAKHLRVLGACLQAAVFYRYADSNPVRELPPAQRPRPEHKEAAYFENDELPDLFAHLVEEPYRTLCLVALKTGMSCWRDKTCHPGGSDSLIFHGEDGDTFLTPSVLLRSHLYPAMASAKISRVGPTQEKRTFHSFRHTFAKRALERGAQITWLSRHLGHSSLKVTTDIYGHWERAERKLQAAKMEGAFSV